MSSMYPRTIAWGLTILFILLGISVTVWVVVVVVDDEQHLYHAFVRSSTKQQQEQEQHEDNAVLRRHRRLQGIGMIDPRTVETKSTEQQFQQQQYWAGHQQQQQQQQQQQPPVAQGYGAGGSNYMVPPPPPPPQQESTQGYNTYGQQHQQQQQSFDPMQQQQQQPMQPGIDGYGTFNAQQQQPPPYQQQQQPGSYGMMNDMSASTFIMNPQQQQQQPQVLPPQQQQQQQQQQQSYGGGGGGASDPYGNNVPPSTANDGPSLQQQMQQHAYGQQQQQDFSTTMTQAQDQDQQPQQSTSSSSSSTGFASPPQGTAFDQYVQPSYDVMEGKVQVATAETPSFTLLCNKLLQRRKNKATQDPVFVVQEDPTVCTSPDTFDALYTMMASTIIAQGGSMWRISYQHNCGGSSSSSSSIMDTNHNDAGGDTTMIQKATLQQMLPNDLTLAMGCGLNTVAEMCEALQSSEQPHDLTSIGFPAEGWMQPVNPVLHSNRVTAFRHNIDAATQRILAMEANLHEPPPLLDGSAVIVLDTESPTRGLANLDFDFYMDRITSLQEDGYGVSSIYVVVAPGCQTNPHCMTYSVALQKALPNQFPNMSILVEQAPSSAITYTRMMQAPLLICPPTMTCILPALWKDVYTKTMLQQQNELYPWAQFMVREAVKSFHLQIDYDISNPTQKKNKKKKKKNKNNNDNNKGGE